MTSGKAHWSFGADQLRGCRWRPQGVARQACEGSHGPSIGVVRTLGSSQRSDRRQRLRAPATPSARTSRRHMSNRWITLPGMGNLGSLWSSVPTGRTSARSESFGRALVIGQAVVWSARSLI